MAAKSVSYDANKVLDLSGTEYALSLFSENEKSALQLFKKRGKIYQS